MSNRQVNQKLPNILITTEHLFTFKQKRVDLNIIYVYQVKKKNRQSRSVPSFAAIISSLIRSLIERSHKTTRR